MSCNDKSWKRLAKIGRFRVNWMFEWPRRGETFVLVECGFLSAEADDYINPRAHYLAIGKLVFLWLKGIKRPLNVLELRRGRKTRP